MNKNYSTLAEKGKKKFKELLKIAEDIKTLNDDVIINFFSKEDLELLKKNNLVNLKFKNLVLSNEEYERLNHISNTNFVEIILISLSDEEKAHDSITNLKSINEFKINKYRKFYKLYKEILENNKEIRILCEKENNLELQADYCINQLELVEEEFSINNSYRFYLNYDKEKKLLTCSILVFNLLKKKRNFEFNIISSEQTQKDINMIDEIIKKLENDIEYLNKKIEIENNDLKIETFKIGKYDKQIFFNDNVASQLNKIKNDKEETIYALTTTKGKKEYIKALLKNAKAETDQVLNSMDLLILEKIYTITKNKKYFDIQEIKKTLIQGETKNHTKIDDIIYESIEKMRFTAFTLKISEKINQTFKKQLSDTILNQLELGSYLLPVNTYKMNKNGNVVEVYILMEEPLFFTYEVARNQLITIDSSKLKIESLSNTEDNVLLKNYTLKRIQNIINNKYDSKSNLSKITYDSLFIQDTELLKDINPSSEKYKYKKRDLRDKLKIILDDCKKNKYIKDYKEYQNNGKIIGIQIII